MSFGSGGGGFTPSPNFIPGATTQGDSLDNKHQVTGSLDITGSLTINGVQITTNGGGGGGGGSPGGSNTQVQFNNGGNFGGSAAFTFNGTTVKNTGAQLIATSTGTIGVGTTAPIAKLHISSSSPVPLLRIDATEQDTNQPILFVTGSGLVGIGTDAPRTDGGDTNRLHILGESGATNGQNPVVNTLLMLENNDHANIQFSVPNQKAGQITWGNAADPRKATFYFDTNQNLYTWEGRATGTGYGNCRVMTVQAAGDGVNIGSSSADHMTTNKASLHISSSTDAIDAGGGVLFRIDHANQPLGQPTMLVSGSGLTGIGTSTPSARLHISSSGQAPLLRIDGTEQDTNLPILFVTGSGLVAIGTDAPRTDTDDTNRLHILGESGADQGQNPVNNTLLMLENNDHAGVQFMTPTTKSGFICWGDADAARVAHFYYHHNDNRFTFDGPVYGTKEAMTVRASGDSVNMGASGSAHMQTDKAALHISSSQVGTDIGGPVLLRLDHADQPGAQPLLFVTGSGRVGIGTGAPESTLEVRSTTTQQKWSYDDDHEFTVTVGSNGETVLAVSGTTTAGLGSSDLALDVSKGGDIFFRRAGDRLRFGISTGDTFIQTDNQSTDLVFRMHPDGGLGAVGTEVARFDASGAGALLMSGTISTPGGNAPINFRDTETSIHSPSPNVLEINSLASGSSQLIVSGAFGNTDFETRSTNYSILSPSGTSVVDTTSLANNITYIYSIEDGSFVGQEKKIFGKITFLQGQTTNSNALMITGSNIEGTDFGQGFVTALLSGTAGTGGMSLVWSGTKWLCVGQNNFTLQ